MEKINIKFIQPDPNQPRKFFDAEKIAKLKKSIERYGIINPLVVEKIDATHYLLVDGERRFKAATAVGLKEVPVNVMPPQEELDRLVRQFHIQEQQEGWSSIEKASVLDKLCTDLGIHVEKACELLGIPNRTGASYVAFSKLADKDLFVRAELNLKLVPSIISLRELSRKLIAEEFDEKFTRTDEKNFEKIIIQKIVDGELQKPGDFAMIKDSFNTSPKIIKKFMTTDTNVARMFKDTKAKSAHHLRNSIINASWLGNHLNSYMEDPQIKPTDKALQQIRFAKKALDKFLSMF